MIPREVREQIEALLDRDPPRPSPMQAASRIAWNGALQKVVEILDAHDAAERRDRAFDFAERNEFDMP